MAGAAVSPPCLEAEAMVDPVAPQLSLSDDETERQRADAARQNALTPLGSLPPDLLVHIAIVFIHRNRCISKTSLFIISSIFQRLRCVVLGAPELWSYINIAWLPGFLDLVLSRSKKSALHLIRDAGDLGCINSSVREVFLSLLPPARSLVIGGCGESANRVQNFWNVLSDIGVPALEVI
jgi:hypothetical protein